MKNKNNSWKHSRYIQFYVKVLIIYNFCRTKHSQLLKFIRQFTFGGYYFFEVPYFCWFYIYCIQFWPQYCCSVVWGDQHIDKLFNILFLVWSPTIIFMFFFLYFSLWHFQLSQVLSSCIRQQKQSYIENVPHEKT